MSLHAQLLLLLINTILPLSPAQRLAKRFQRTPHKQAPQSAIITIACTTDPAEEAIVSRITARRAPRPLQPLDLTLLHSPPVADGWNSFLGAVRTQTIVPADLRELAISRVAVVNRAWYEWMHHAPLAVGAGVPQAAMDWLKGQAGDLAEPSVAAEGTDLFGEGQWAALLLADEMTRNVQVSDETFAKVKGLFGEREVVELVATVACYNCVSRFLVALDVGERNATGPDAPAAH
ncbi:Metacaspase-1 [Verticillium dahliae VDG2]|nr:Metacaspase-1 [Verticillium dahliae VDG2]